MQCVAVTWVFMVSWYALSSKIETNSFLNTNIPCTIQQIKQLFIFELPISIEGYYMIYMPHGFLKRGKSITPGIESVIQSPWVAILISMVCE